VTAAKRGEIYSFSSFGAFFADYVKTRKGRDKLTYGTLARRLKLKSPSLLAMIARGERQPTPTMLHRLAEFMALTPAERLYADALVGFERAKDIDEQLRCARELKRLKPMSSELVLELDALEMIAKWYAVVILEMTKLPGFRADPAWISQRLGTTVSADMVRDALSTLERGQLTQTAPGGRLRKVADIVRSTVNIPATAIRSFHKQVLLRAHQAIDRQEVSERYFTTLTLAVPRAKIPLAGSLIGQFRDDFMTSMGDVNETADEIYHLAVQFFRATDQAVSPPRKDPDLTGD